MEDEDESYEVEHIKLKHEVKNDHIISEKSKEEIKETKDTDHKIVKPIVNRGFQQISHHQSKSNSHSVILASPNGKMDSTVSSAKSHQNLLTSQANNRVKNNEDERHIRQVNLLANTIIFTQFVMYKLK